MSEDSPAAAAGLTSGDTITSVEGVPVHTMETLIAQLRRYPAGMSISVSLEGPEILTVTLGDRA